ncbi:hypothetical protein [Salinarimonas sp.]|uniref:hypothetical protein n=1 Tax=Salinarimonas sp. TaxID=2766526 RepID=UPI0032D8F30A
MVALLAFAALSAALSFSFMLLPSDTSRAAADAGEFRIPAVDGYGATSCLAEGEACGAVVARSWCEAHGFTRVVRFGAVEDGHVAISCAP